jgi:hypothetical protein
MHACDPSYYGSIGRRIKVHPRLACAKTQDPIRKITKAKKGWSVAQMVEYFA